MCEESTHHPISSQTTTQSGESVNISIVDGMLDIGTSFICQKCHRTIKRLTLNYRCPYCNRNYEKYLF